MTRIRFIADVDSKAEMKDVVEIMRAAGVEVAEFSVIHRTVIGFVDDLGFVETVPGVLVATPREE